MIQVYVVTYGDYSEFRIRGIFSTMDNAVAFRNHELQTSYAGEYEINDIETWTLDKHVDLISQGHSHYHIIFEDDTRSEAKVDIEQADETLSWRAGEGLDAFWRRRGEDTWVFETLVWAKDEAAALKVANERRVQRVVAREGSEVASEK